MPKTLIELKEALSNKEIDFEFANEEMTALRSEKAELKSTLENAPSDNFKTHYVNKLENNEDKIESKFLEIQDIQDEIKSLRGEIALEEKKQIKFQKKAAEGASLISGEDLDASVKVESTKTDNKVIVKTAYEIDPNSGKSKYAEMVFEKKGDVDYDPIYDSILFLKSKMEDTKDWEAYHEKAAQAVSVSTHYDTESTSATDIAGTAPGYDTSSGLFTPQPLPKYPKVLIEMINLALQRRSNAKWLLPTKTANAEGFIEIIDEFLGGGWTAELEVKKILSLRDFRVYFKYKKFAGRNILSEEAIRFNKRGQQILENWTTYFVARTAQAIDEAFISGRGGTSIIGLADQTIRGKRMSTSDGIILAPVHRNLNQNGSLALSLIDLDFDNLDLNRGAKAIIDSQYVLNNFAIGNTTGGMDLPVLDVSGFGEYNYRGIQIRTSKKMFANKYQDGVIGVIDMGGSAFYEPVSPWKFLRDEYSYADVNAIQLIGDYFVDLVVEKASNTILLIDNYSFFAKASATTSAGATDLKTVLQSRGGAFPVVGSMYRVVSESGAILAGPTAVKADGAITFVIAGGTSGDKVNIVDGTGAVVGQGTLS